MIKIISAGFNYIHHEGWRIDRPEGLKFYLFLHIKAPFSMLLDGKEQFFSSPAYIIYPPNVSQLFFSDDSSYSDDWIHFYSDDEDMTEFFKGLDLPLGRPIFMSNTLEISTLIQGIDNECHCNGAHHETIMDLKFKTMCYKFSDVHHVENTLPDNLNKFRHLFNGIRSQIYHFDNATKIQGVNELAESVNLSLSYFQHIYKALFGVTVVHDLIAARIEYASYLLQNNANSIGDVAAYCGYANIEHFTRQFKQVKGFSPKKYQTLIESSDS